MASDNMLGADDIPAGHDLSLTELELELVRLRSEARAARYEARAAALELQARRLQAETLGVEQGLHAAADVTAMPDPSPAAVTGGWGSLEAAARRRRSGGVASPDRQAESRGSGKPIESQTPDRSLTRDLESRAAKLDPRLPDRGEVAMPAGSAAKRSSHSRTAAVATESSPLALPTSPPAAKHRPRRQGAQRAKRARGESPTTVPVQQMSVAKGQRPGTRRRRPVAWFLSTALHLMVLLGLAALSLSVPPRRDQLALSATPVTAAEEELESVTIEPLDSTETFSEPDVIPVDETVPVDPLGDIAAVAPPSPPAAPATGAVVSPQATQVSTEMLIPTTKMTTEFCGVAGGGNHFCYVVDSSQSMKNGRFESARAALLQSINQLSVDQRFYVIFYDTNVDRMRISDASHAEEYSVSATAENKRALRRWALSVGLERGAPPDEALEFAFQLRPDVIFLLSDGEFPQRIETLVGELNRDDSLFGDQGPRTILHTIGYHSREGESRMRRLAEKNGGKYRYVAGP